MALPDLSCQNIQDTYQRLLQISRSGDIVDGTGSLYLPPSASFAITASYAISASHETTFELSSSHAQLADNLTGIPNISVNHITASGDISSINDVLADKFISNGVQVARQTSNIIILGNDTNTNYETRIVGGDDAGITLKDNVTASNISASGYISASKIKANTLEVKDD